MSERLTSLASGTRAVPGRAAPRTGAPPGGRFLESFPQNTSPKKAENPFKSFQKIETVRTKTTEIPKSKSSFETVKLFKIESKPQTIRPTEAKGSQRFTQLGNTREYRINRNIDPLDRQIPKSEVPKPQQRTEVPDVFKEAFAKSPESTLNPTKTKIPEPFYKAFEPEVKTRRTQLIENLKSQKAPLAEISRKTRRESIVSLMKNQQISLGEALKQDIPPTTARTELIKGLLENKSISLQDALKKNDPTEIKKTEPVNDKRKMVADLLMNNGASLVEVFEKAVPEKALPEIPAKSPNKARRELIAGLIKDQKVSLADIVETKIKNNFAEVSALKQELPKAELKNMISFKTVEQNLEVVRKVLAENKQSPEQKLDQTILTEVINQPNIIDFQKAKDLIEQKQEKQTEVIKPNNTPQIEAALKVFQEPARINIEPEKRAQAVELIKEVANTKEYAVNPKLQEQIKAVVKKEQERVIEEYAMQKTAQAMTEAGIEPTIIAQRLEAVVETKNVPINKEQIEQMLEKAEAKMLEFPKLMVKDGEVMKEEDDENQLMLTKIQELLIELDEKTLENRFKAIFAAFDKSWIKAQEEGKENIDGNQLLENLVIPSSKVLDSAIIRPLDQTDGTLIETTKDIAQMGKYDNYDQARQVLANILLNHLPGKATSQTTTQQLSDQQVKEIFYGGNLPINIGKPYVINSVAA
jgi:hypothetical protein